MSTYTEANLQALLTRFTLARKILLCEHYNEGHLILERLCRTYGSVLHTEVQTIEGLAVRETELALFRKGMRYVRRQTTYWIVQHLMQHLASEPGAYIAGNLLTPGIVDRVHQAVCELREAGISAAQMDIACFLDPRKGTYMKRLLAAYELYLTQHKLVDYPGLSDHLEPSGGAETVYIHEDAMQLSHVSRRMLRTFAGDRLFTYDGDLPFDHPQSGFPAQEARLFHAAGGMAEVREVLRRLLAAGTPFDQTEIIVSDYEAGAGAVYSAAEATGIPCTFSRGLPLGAAGAGRAALQALDWLEGGFHAEPFISMLREGVVTFRRQAGHVAAYQWIRELERCAIGWGRERYLQLLDPDTAGADEESRYRLEQLRGWFGGLFQGLPEAGSAAWSPKLLLAWLSRFLERFACRRDEDDVLVITAVKDLAESLAELSAPVVDMSRELSIHYVRQALSGIRVFSTPMPKPGAVHVASLTDGGQSGRPFVYVTGMDEHSWSGTVRQNPILLDEERRALSAELPVSGEQSKRQREQRLRLLGGIRGKGTFSYSSYNLTDGKSVSPAFELLQIFRLQAEEPEADFSALQRALGEPAGYFGRLTESSSVLDDGDVWAGELRSPAGWKDGRTAIYDRAFWLVQGSRAAAQREEQVAVTEYDGLIGGPEWELYWHDKQVGSISASRLERYAECPLKYFYSYVLGFWPKEAPVYDRAVWLQPMDRGNLLHRVFYDYLRTVTLGGSEAPLHNREELARITEQVLGEYERLIPAPSPHILYKERAELLQDIELFYQEETVRSSLPRFFEQELSVDGEPITVRLSETVSLRLKGFVDRIDETAPHEYRIIDYKTGSSGKYKENEFFAGGTQLQHALYAAAAEQWLQRAGIDDEAKVGESVYYFPTMKGIGREVIRLQNKREALANVIGRLLMSMERGVFVPTSDAKRCRWCEYSGVCGSQAVQMAEKRSAAENLALLQPLLEVESLG